MPSRKSAFRWLLEKEFRELIASRSWWVLLLLMGPLVGMSFISSARTYAEVSGLNGGSAGVGEAMSPLIGVWAPTFSACELAAVFLLPFVAIRLVAGDRESGALKLELQQSIGSFARVAAKAIVLLAGWLVAMLPPLSAILLWMNYGGSVYPPELLTLTIGHPLNAGLTLGLAAALASLAEHHSTAAILTLSRNHRHLDRQFCRVRARRLVGTGSEIHARRDGLRNFNMDSSSSTSSSSHCC